MSPDDGKLRDEVIDLACELMSRRSITPADEGCQQLIGQRLEVVGMTVENMDSKDVSNLFAHHGSGRPHLMLVGDRKSTRLNSSHVAISYAVFCLKKKK